MIKLNHISYSLLDKYIRCPRAFKYRYIDHIEEKPTTSMMIGLAVHRGIETFIKEGKEKAMQQVTESVNNSEDLSESLWMLNITIEMLESHSYMRSELKLRSRIPGLPPLISIWDIAQPTDTFYRVIEVKTSWKIPDKRTLETSLQPRFYKLVMMRNIKDYPLKFTYYYPRYNETIETEPEPLEIDYLKSLVNQIESDTEFKPKVNGCQHCPYLYHCDAGKECHSPEETARALIYHKAKYQELMSQIKTLTKESPLEIDGYKFGYKATGTKRVQTRFSIYPAK